MRWVVDGCRPVFSLISFSEMASSREASTSINWNMRSSTWTLGLAGASGECFFMRQGRTKEPVILSCEMPRCFYSLAVWPVRAFLRAAPGLVQGTAAAKTGTQADQDIAA